MTLSNINFAPSGNAICVCGIIQNDRKKKVGYKTHIFFHKNNIFLSPNKNNKCPQLLIFFIKNKKIGKLFYTYK